MVSGMTDQSVSRFESLLGIKSYDLDALEAFPRPNMVSKKNQIGMTIAS